MAAIWGPLAAVAIAIVYAVVCTLILLAVIDKVFGFRSTVDEEMEGLDSSYHSEHGYGMVPSRAVRYLPAPSQIRTSSFPAYGSS